MQKYFINTENPTGGKITGFIESNTHYNHEVTNEQHFQAQNITENNTLHKDVDGNITFSLVDYETIESVRTKKTSEIKKDCTATHPHTIFTTLSDMTEKNITWNGGDASAIAIEGAVRLAQLNNPTATTLQLWDIDNKLHTLTNHEALEVSKKIAGKYQNDMIKRQILITQVNDATTKEEIEIINW